MLLFISPLIVVSICHMYWGAPMLNALIIVISSYWIDPLFIMLHAFLSLVHMCMCTQLLQLCPTATVSPVACQAPLSMGFSRQEYCRRLLCPPSGHHPNLEIKPAPPVSPSCYWIFLYPPSHLGSPIFCEVKWSEAKVSQSCLTLCDSMDYTVHGNFQARILEWVAFPFSRASS